METVKSLERSGLLKRVAGEIIKSKAKVQKDRFLSISLGSFGDYWLEKVLAGKGVHVDDGII